MLLSYDQIGTVGDGFAVRLGNNRMSLENARADGWPDTMTVLSLLGERTQDCAAMLVRIALHDGQLVASPLALAGESGVLRLC
jgi:hypothetical protein